MSIERPILMSGPLVRRVLDGSKTQTRRLVANVEWPPEMCEPDLRNVTATIDRGIACANAEEWRDGQRAGWVSAPISRRRSPFGAPGDRLWVRENWRPIAWTDGDDVKIRYPADGAEEWHSISSRDGNAEDAWWEWVARLPSTDGEVEAKDIPTRPSIHMPRWACRLTLTIGAVRVERLQEISVEDCMAEGIRWEPGTPWLCDEARGTTNAYRSLFADLWDLLAPNGAKWSDNPWVWAISFTRDTTEHAQ
jgi:hypothetical protein